MQLCNVQNRLKGTHFHQLKKKVVFLTYNLKTEWLHFLHIILLIHISYALKIPVFGYQLTIHAMSV